MTTEIIKSDTFKGYDYEILKNTSYCGSWHLAFVIIPKSSEWHGNKGIPVECFIEPNFFAEAVDYQHQEYGVPLGAWLFGFYSEDASVEDLDTALTLIINQLDGLRRMAE